MNIQSNRQALRDCASTTVDPSPILLTLVVLAVLVVVALAAGCSGPPPTPVDSRPSTSRARPLQPTQPPPTSEAAKADDITLTWWTPEFLSREVPGAPGKVLADQLSAFERKQDGKVRVETVRKARYGKGGLLDALRTAQPVADDTLPDVVALDAAEVERAVEAGLLQPLDALLDTKIIEGLYPFASEAGLFGKHLYAVQVAADVEHVAYIRSQMAEAPTRWDELLARRTAYLFPLGGAKQANQVSGADASEGLSHAVLSQYLSAGATLAPDRRLVLEPQPLLSLLTFYADASTASVLPSSAPRLPDGEAVWDAFSLGEAPLVDTSARRFLARGDMEAGYAATPGQTGPAPSIASGWVLAIVTPEPQRQRKAAELIAWLLRPDNAGAWARSANWLPTSSDALKLLGSGSYWDFLDGLLSQARSAPAGQDYAATAARIRAAIKAVLQGQSAPAAATEAAINGEQ